MGYGKRFNDWDLDANDCIKTLKRKVAKLPIAQVLQHHGVEIAQQSGYNLKALCPFHVDDSIGSFIIDTNHNRCKCFACDGGGGVIKSMQQLLGLRDEKDVILKIACDEGLIDEVEFERLSGAEYDGSDLTEVKKTYKPKEKKRPANSTYALWTIVYEYFRDFFGLTEEHYNILKNERNVSDERIRKDYFSIDTTDKATVSRLIYCIRRDLPEVADKLSQIPGFFEEKRYGTNDWYIQMFSMKGIGILIRNAYGQVIGIQVRQDVDDKGCRYKYLSGNVDSSRKNATFRGGASAGTPIDVLISNESNDRLAIVEGRFKSEILAMQNLTSLSVQGVNSFDGIEKDIASVESLTGRKIRKVFLFYDADFVENLAVYRAGTKLKAYLAEKRPDIDFCVAVWDEVYGKGIDDMILAGYRPEVKFIKGDFYEKVFVDSYYKAAKIVGIDTENLAGVTKEDRARFTEVAKAEIKKVYKKVL